MGGIVNLRLKRKAAARKAARQTSDANAARFGQTKSEKDLAKARALKSERRLDGHKRDAD